MLAALLALAASAGGPPLMAYEIATCPPAPGSPQAEEQIAAEQARAQCFERAMCAEVAAPSGAALRDGQAGFERWGNLACWLSGELAALDLAHDKLLATPASVRLQRVCLQSVWAERAFRARDPGFDPITPPGDSQFGDVVHSRQAAGATVRLQLARLLASLRQPPPPAGALKAADRERIARAIDLVWRGAVDQAQQECAARREGSLCGARLEAYYFSLVNPYPGGTPEGR